MLFIIATIALSLFAFAKANHSVCGWTGPGAGDPTKYGFKQYCFATRVEVIPYGGDPDKPDKALWICEGIGKVADWNVLRPGILEMATPCNSGGYAGGGHGHCPKDNWGLVLSKPDSSDPTYPAYYITGFNDCEWPGNFTVKSLPLHITVYNK